MNYKKYALITALLLPMTNPSFANTYGDWFVKQGGTAPNQYRFTEQYAKTTDCKTQRVDFTYSKSSGWSFTVTTRNIADRITLIVDGKSHEFLGGGSFHKLNFQIEASLIEQVMSAQHPVLLIESYNGGSDYHSVISVKGSSAALRWVSDI